MAKNSNKISIIKAVLVDDTEAILLQSDNMDEIDDTCSTIGNILSDRDNHALFLAMNSFIINKQYIKYIAVETIELPYDRLS